MKLPDLNHFSANGDQMRAQAAIGEKGPLP
jgi:hypothetical protein